MSRHKEIDIIDTLAKIETMPDKHWIWNRSITKDGHGRLRVDGKMMVAHRHIFEMYYNVRLASNLVVRHTCDRPGCINPRHLLLGSNADNVADRHNRQRDYFVVHPNKRQEIKDKYNTKEYTQTELGNIYKVTQSAISRILNDNTNH